MLPRKKSRNHQALFPASLKQCICTTCGNRKPTNCLVT